MSLAQPPFSQWQDDVQAIWDRGEQQSAIDLLLQRINAAAPQIPKPLGLQLIYYIFLLGDLGSAEHFLQRLLAVHPDDPEILENLAVVLSRQGKSANAIPLFQQVIALQPESANAWDGLAICAFSAGDEPAARAAGERSLALKTAAARSLPNWSLPSGSPTAYLERPAAEQRRDVIAFSLWGSNPRYLRGALRNALLIPEFYPGWIARFHLDATVPEDIVALLEAQGADIRRMPEGQSLRQKLCWRFQVANDPAVGRFLVRDCDSVVHQREVFAVQQWITSGCWFHVMRDWWTHTDPILAGLWGGIGGVLPDLSALLRAYSPAAKETANVDQWFLRDVLWGSIRPHALIHDRCYRSEGSQPWPSPTPSGSHVGQNEFAVRQGQQALWLASWIRRHPSLQLPGEGPLLPARLPEPDLAQHVVMSWTVPSNPQVFQSMPEGVTGRVLNLDRATERWQNMQAQINSLGWQATHRRQPAMTAPDQEAKNLGLRNGAELGLWRTTMAVMENWLSNERSENDVLHLLEDDAILHPSLPLLIEPLLQGSPQLDMVFSEAFLTLPLYRRFRALEQRRLEENANLYLLNGGQYLACASSYLVTVKGARKLLNQLQQVEAAGRLIPLDMAFRKAIRSGSITAALSLPFFSTITATIDSAIQNDRNKAIYLSQVADLSLRRLLYLQSWHPEVCPSVLKELTDVLSSGLESSQNEALVLEILNLGKSEGWLISY